MVSKLLFILTMLLAIFVVACAGNFGHDNNIDQRDIFRDPSLQLGLDKGGVL